MAPGGPGSGRATQCKMLVQRYQGWVHISMGDLLRDSILEKGNMDAKWGAVSQLVSKGELAPEVGASREQYASSGTAPVETNMPVLTQCGLI